MARVCQVTRQKADVGKSCFPRQQQNAPAFFAQLQYRRFWVETETAGSACDYHRLVCALSIKRHRRMLPEMRARGEQV